MITTQNLLTQLSSEHAHAQPDRHTHSHAQHRHTTRTRTQTHAHNVRRCRCLTRFFYSCSTQTARCARAHRLITLHRPPSARISPPSPAHHRPISQFCFVLYVSIDAYSLYAPCASMQLNCTGCLVGQFLCFYASVRESISIHKTLDDFLHVLLLL